MNPLVLFVKLWNETKFDPHLICCLTWLSLYAKNVLFFQFVFGFSFILFCIISLLRMKSNKMKWKRNPHANKYWLIHKKDLKIYKHVGQFTVWLFWIVSKRIQRSWWLALMIFLNKQLLYVTFRWAYQWQDTISSLLWRYILGSDCIFTSRSPPPQCSV